METMLFRRSRLQSSINGTYHGEPYMQSLKRSYELHGSTLTLTAFVALLYPLMATHRSRRSWLFAVNCLSISLALSVGVVGIFGAGALMDEYFSPSHQATVKAARLMIAYDFVVTLAPLTATGTLYSRLDMLFPAAHGKLKRRWILTSFLVILALRLVNCIILVVTGVIDILRPAQREDVQAMEADYNHQDGGIGYVIDPFLGLLGGTLAWTLLLSKSRAISRNVAARMSRGPGARANRERLRLFVESTTMTFLPPVLCQIVMVVSYWFKNVTAQRAANQAAIYNVHLSLVFSLLANTWSTLRLQQTGGARRQSLVHPATRKQVGPDETLLSTILRWGGIFDPLPL